MIHRIQALGEKSIASITSGLMPYGLNTSARGKNKKSDGDLTLYASNSITYIHPNEVTKGNESIYTYRVMISKTSAEHAGEPGKDGMFRVIPSTMKVIEPGDVCTHSYFVVGAFSNKCEAEFVCKYLKTRFVRALILVCISGFGLSKLALKYVPLQKFTTSSDIDWSQPIPQIDQQLYRKYGLTDEEISFIETHVKEMN